MKIAVSSGHRKSWLLAYADGERLSDAHGPLYLLTSDDSLNLHCLDPDQLRDRLRRMFDRLRADLPDPLKARGLTAADRLVVSLPGVSSTADHELGVRSVLGAGWPGAEGESFVVVDDTYAGLIGGARCARGICAFAGTGASVYLGESHLDEPRTFIPSKAVKLDGFGPMIGDHGSAFRLAMATLERMGRDIDEDLGDRAVLDLFESLFKGLGTDWRLINDRGLQNGFDELMANRGPEWRLRIADLAPVITRAAAAGNWYAAARLDDAARAMATTLKVGFKRFPDLDDAHVYCQGGMFRHSDLYLAKVRQHLGRPQNPVEVARYRPVVGALLLAASPGWTVYEGVDSQARLLAAVDARDGSADRLVFRNA